MADSQYPNTGWFTVGEQPNCKREYCYNLIADKFITWSTKETKKSKSTDRNVVKEINNLIYIKQAFGNPIAIAEKRSFIFKFKSFVIRNKKGILAGLYSYLKNNSIVIFYPESITQDYLIEPVRKNVKFSLDEIGSEQMNRELQVLAKYVVEMNMEISWSGELRFSSDWAEKQAFAFNYLCEMLNSYKQAVKDRRFVNEFNEIDLWIEDEL